ncbi:p53-like transcription factor [Piromyces finnis]|uniref:p53-like transcription factor n=1 Tax=Piromyces finnis TaxID=1754191 RepID=A0A1Y1VHN8_9FUNG|nr:p53-like transcription factor [Piromyces finnis]|eukprot:ORX56540.1 p53-like transcription factor [Piromyces finnis]
MENGSPMPNNKLNNNKRLLKKNEQKLSIDTSFINPCRNDTQSSVYNCSNKDSYNIKTPTSAKSQKNSSQMNTPPKTPVKEKNKKKRGDHIHYNIKTNMFMETQQYYEVFNFGKTKSYNLKIIPKVDRGFFPTGPEKDFTCYRRNYFQISASFSAKNIKDPSLFSPCFLKVGNTFLSIQNFYIGICAKVKDSNKEIRVVQQTAKREKGPQNKPIPKVCKPGGNPSCYHGVNSNQSIVTFERLQFKSATPNTNRRSSKQQFYALVIDLYASTPFKRYKVATIESKRLIVRSRSPGHYQNSSEYDDPCLNDDSNESSVTCNDAKEDFNSPDFKNIPSTSDSSNINPTEEGCNKQQYTNPVQKNCNEQPNDPIQNNYNEHYTNSIQNNYNEHYTNPIQNNYNEHYTNPIQNNYNEHYTNPIQNNYNEHYMNNQNVNFMNSNNGQFDPANSINSTFQANNDRNSNNAFNPYTLPFNDNRNCIDNNTAANSSYLEENNAPRMNYQNSIPSNATTGSFYPINDINTPIDSPAQNGYMYQTPQLPSQQDSSLNANLTYNTTKQDFVPQYSSDNQNSYSPYVPSQVPSIFPSQAQSSQVQAYSSDNYYAQNPNQNAQIPSSPMNNPPISQNVGNASQSSYYPSNNQEFIYSNQVAPPPSYQQTPSQQQTSSSNAVSSPINGNYSVPSWTTNGVF